jgi:RNA polymerase sigma-70 factor, ECF subfamily
MSDGERPPLIPPSLVPLFKERFYPLTDYIWTVLRSLGVLDADLEDATEDVLVGVASKMTEYDPSRPPRPWLLPFIRFTAFEYGRRARKHRDNLSDINEEALEIEALSLGAELQLDASRAREAVREALDTLNEELRYILVMSDVLELSMETIAAELSIPINTGYSRLRRARELFKKAIMRVLMRRGNL